MQIFPYPDRFFGVAHPCLDGDRSRCAGLAVFSPYRSALAQGLIYLWPDAARVGVCALVCWSPVARGYAGGRRVAFQSGRAKLVHLTGLGDRGVPSGLKQCCGAWGLGEEGGLHPAVPPAGCAGLPQAGGLPIAQGKLVRGQGVRCS